MENKQEFTIRDMRFLDEERKKVFEVGGGAFKIKALFPKEHKEIARRVAMEQNGLPSNSFSMDDKYRFSRDATIDTAIIESPEWWKNAGECPEEAFLEELFEIIVKWTNEFQDLLKKNRLNKREPQGTVQG